MRGPLENGGLGVFVLLLYLFVHRRLSKYRVVLLELELLLGVLLVFTSKANMTCLATLNFDQFVL